MARQATAKKSEAVRRAELPGKAVPFWIDSTPEPDFPALERNVSVDVAVIGGGMAGITTALLLKETGAKVAVIEADRVLKGVTGHTTAKLTSLHTLVYKRLEKTFGEEGARQYADANQSAIERIASIAESRNIDCDFRRLPAYTYAEGTSEVKQIEEEAEIAQRLGLPAFYTEELPLPFRVRAAVGFRNQAQFHPRKFLLPLAQTIPDESGSYVFERTRAMRVEEGEKPRVMTDRGTVEAGHVVVATNYPFLDRGLFFARMAPVRSYVLGVQLKERAPEGMFITAGEPMYSLRPHFTDGGTFALIGGEKHRTGMGGDTIGRYEMLERYARSRFDLASIDYRWSTRTTTPRTQCLSSAASRAPGSSMSLPGSRAGE